MGGNAMKEHGAVRLPKENLPKFLEDLVSTFADIDMRMIPYVLEKEDFGDVDVIVLGTFREVAEEIIDSVSEFKKVNGNVTSFIYQNVQVDFIYLPECDVDFATNYFAFNDLGNLIGHIAHKMGMKFGHDGLWLPVRDGDNKLGEIILTKNYAEAISYLGFDLSRYVKGFDTFEEMFEFIEDSKYFNPKIYPLEHRNHTARVRDRKRTTYMKFLKWCDNLDKNDYFDFANKNHYLVDILHYFKVSGHYYDLWREYAWRKFQRDRFSTGRVKELTGLDGKCLGRFIKYLKNDTSFDLIILSHSVEEVDSFIIARLADPWDVPL